MTVTRATLVELLIQQFNCSKQDAIILVQSFFDVLTQSLFEDGTLKLKNIGQLLLHQKKARVGRNPKTKKRTEIPARKVVLFRASKNLKEALKEGE